jgi:hypothetical protein
MGGGALVVGALSDNNLVLDNRGITACNNAAGSALDLQKRDGDQSEDVKFIVKATSSGRGFFYLVPSDKISEKRPGCSKAVLSTVQYPDS